MPSSINSLLEEYRLQNTYIDYAEILKAFNIDSFMESGFYYSVGRADQSEGWILHISVWRIQFIELSLILIPYLISNSHAFKIPLNSNVHDMLQNGNLGYTNLGKIIIITQKIGTDLTILAKDLIKLSAALKGPAIPTDFHLGNLLYTRYGSYENIEAKYIINPKGEKVNDEEQIPFKLLTWLNWPFNEIKQFIDTKEKKIIHGEYYIHSTIKNDSKGFIMIALYQKSFLNFKKCIIKEGRMGMGSDIYGRDIESRLLWQKELHQKLFFHIPIPKFIDLFKEDNNSYLSIEYINGISLGSYLDKISEGNHWDSISLKKRIQILNILDQIIDIVKKLHHLNYIHRDLNTENFLITQNLKVYIIDLELTYNMETNFPNPPYEKGTEGYMSPEQNLNLIPSTEQDIYSLGAILVNCFTNILPYKFNPLHQDTWSNNLNYLITDKMLVRLIGSCLNTSPKNRPSLDTIKIQLAEFRVRQIKRLEVQNYHIDKDLLRTTIIEAISSLFSKNMIDSFDLWTSTVSMRDNLVGNIRLDRTIYPGFRKGISGILFLLGRAKAAGFDIEIYRDTWTKNFIFLNNLLSSDEYITSPGLSTGFAGIALGIHSSIKNGLIPYENSNIQSLIKCFTQIPTTLDFDNGLSGIGLALIRCKDVLPEEIFDHNLNTYLEFIYQNQKSNGSWLFDTKVKSRPIILSSFDQGIAGIVYFLLNCLEVKEDEKIKSKTLLAIHYLVRLGKSSKGHLIWPLTKGSKEINEFVNGGFRMLLPFIKYYVLTGDNKYKKIVEDILYSYPARISADFINQERGLSGLGETYLEAWLAFRNVEWLHRAEWIAGFFIHTIHGKEQDCYWLEFDPFRPSPDLLTGQSGIIHFLLRLYNLNVPHIY